MDRQITHGSLFSGIGGAELAASKSTGRDRATGTPWR